MKYVKKIGEAIWANILVVIICVAIIIQFPFVVVIYKIRCDDYVQRSKSVYIMLPFIGFIEMWSEYGKLRCRYVKCKK